MTTPAPPIQQKPQSVGDRFKAAGLLAVKQAQKVKLLNITLPAAYRALGRQIYNDKKFIEDFPEIYRTFEALVSELKANKIHAAERPVAEGITAKAKAAAAGVIDAGKQKAIEVKTNQNFARLGELAYSRHGLQSGTSEVVQPIIKSQTELQSLELEIVGFSATATALPKAEFAALANAKKAVSRILQNPVVIAGLLVFCFPLGLWLVWRNPARSKIRKLSWTGLWTAVVVLIGVAVKIQDQAAQKELSEANALWDAGEHPAAVDKYRDLVSNSLVYVEQSDRPLLYRRIIDSDVDNNLAEAHRFINEVLDQGLDPGFLNPNAVALLSQVKQERIEKEQQAEAQKQADAEITEDFLPYKSGATATYLHRILFPNSDDGMETPEHWNFKTDQSVEIVPMYSSSIRTGVDLPGTYRFPIRYGSRRRRDDFIETGEPDEQSGEVTWHTVLKIGAKAGETWNGIDLGDLGESKYTVREFGTCTVLSKSWPTVIVDVDLSFNVGAVRHIVGEATYAKGLGLVRDRRWIVNNGVKQPVGDLQLDDPKGVQNLTDDEKKFFEGDNP